MAHRELFVSLPVHDVVRSVECFTNLGFQFDERFTDETATGMVIGKDAYAMLLREPLFAEFTTQQICDCTTHGEAMLAVSAKTREAVDHAVDAALAAGGSRAGETQERGFMYARRSFDEPDGDHWNVFWMDTAGAAQAVAGAASTS